MIDDDNVDDAPVLFHVSTASRAHFELFDTSVISGNGKVLLDCVHCPGCQVYTRSLLCSSCIEATVNGTSTSRICALQERLKRRCELVNMYRQSNSNLRDPFAAISEKTTVINRLKSCREILLASRSKKYAMAESLRNERGVLSQHSSLIHERLNKLRSKRLSCENAIAAARARLASVNTAVLTQRQMLIDDLFRKIFPVRGLNQTPMSVQVPSQLAQAALTDWVGQDIGSSGRSQHPMEQSGPPGMVRFVGADVPDTCDLNTMQTWLHQAQKEHLSYTVEHVLENLLACGQLAALAYAADVARHLALLLDVVLPFGVQYGDFYPGLLTANTLDVLVVKLKANVCCVALAAGLDTVYFDKPVHNLLTVSLMRLQCQAWNASDRWLRDFRKACKPFQWVDIARTTLCSDGDDVCERGIADGGQDTTEDDDWESVSASQVPEWRAERPPQSLVNTLLSGTATSVSNFFRAVGSNR